MIKFLTVRMDEEDKRVAKIKKHRDAHVKRSALPAVNAEAAAPAEEAVAAVEAPAVEAPVAEVAPEPVAAEV